jgi:integrase
LTLAAARALAADLYRQREAGQDVIADRKIEKQIRKARVNEPESKFAAVAEQFIDEHARPNTRRWKETAHCLGLDYPEDDDEPTRIKGGLAEQWRDKEITQVTSDDVYRVVDDAKRRGIPGLPRRTKGVSNSRGRAMARVLSKLFGWALEHRKIKTSPSIGVFVPPAPKSRERVLSQDEVVRFWRATDKLNEPFGAMLKLLLLTGARLREVAGMRKAELSEEVVKLPDSKEVTAQLWTVPGTRSKNKRDFIVPLPPLARDILSHVKQLVGKEGFIFSTTGKSPVSGFSKTKKRLDKLMTEAAKKDKVERGSGFCEAAPTAAGRTTRQLHGRGIEASRPAEANIRATEDDLAWCDVTGADVEGGKNLMTKMKLPPDQEKFRLEHEIVAKHARMEVLTARHNRLASLLPKELTQDVVPEMQLTLAEIETNMAELLTVMDELEALCKKSSFFHPQTTEVRG